MKGDIYIMRITMSVFCSFIYGEKGFLELVHRILSCKSTTIEFH